MAQLNFDSMPTTSSSENNLPQVGFFTLKNDGDRAIVRFMHDTTSSFDVLSVHNVTVDGKYRKVSCLRGSANDPMEKCPLCAAGNDTQTRIFIHVIQYTLDPTTNTYKPEAKIWERGLKYAYDLKEKLMNYGPLSNVVFQVTRHGRAGDMKTSYSIDYMPNMQNEQMFPKDGSAFENYKVLGSIVMNKNYEEVNTFVMTGKFPEKVKEEVNESAPFQTAPQTYVAPQQQMPIPPVQQPTQFAPQTAQQAYIPPVQQTPIDSVPWDTNPAANPWDNTSANLQRPKRSY